MKVAQTVVQVSTHKEGLYDITQRVQQAVRTGGITVGLCTVFVQHTSASLVIQENADPSVQRDMQRWMARIAPESSTEYEHDAEGLDDMPAHLRSAVTRTSETIPIRDGSLALGTWQALYLWEHRRAAHTRTLIVTSMGE